MTPDRQPDMEELNKRRIERQLKRQQTYAKKRRKQKLTMLLVILLMIAGGIGVFFLVRARDNKTPERSDATSSTEFVFTLYAKYGSPIRERYHCSHTISSS